MSRNNEGSPTSKGIHIFGKRPEAGKITNAQTVARPEKPSSLSMDVSTMSPDELEKFMTLVLLDKQFKMLP